MASSDEITMSPFGENRLAYFSGAGLKTIYAKKLTQSFKYLSYSITGTLYYIPLATTTSNNSHIIIDNYSTMGIEYGEDDYGIYFKCPNFSGVYGLHLNNMRLHTFSGYGIGGTTGMGVMCWDEYTDDWGAAYNIITTPKSMGLNTTTTAYAQYDVYLYGNIHIPCITPSYRYYPCLIHNQTISSIIDSYKDSFYSQNMELYFDMSW